ncbi:hypothetical protein GPROT2_00872 [Gammaproteobacteria bacterium]|nr:hypothetical protein GPROT2_00872 [Gammaproteobacteria bacterium]
MPRLFIIDHSLISPGGHHYEYDLHVAAAAAGAGWEPVLATNRRFAPHGASLAPWRVIAVFRNDTYNRFTVTSGATSLPQNPYRRGAWQRMPVGGRGPAAWWRRAALLLKQRRRLGRFVRGCEALFAAVAVQPGDVVFVPTLSEFDLVAVLRFLAGRPPAAACRWHLQFHLNYLGGAEPAQDRQAERVAAMRAHFAALLAPAGQLRLAFHATTAQVAAQYNRMGLAPFTVLDYPVSTAFRPLDRTVPSARLRMLSAGGARAEKGTPRLGEVLKEGWDEFFASGRVELLVQVERDAELPVLPGPAAPGIVSRLPFPLSAADYCAMIRAADIGLFLYDPARYQGRASGVLIEMLCSGVPVIVPAGCWLADEIAEANFRHLDVLRARASPLGTACAGDWQPLPPAADQAPPALGCDGAIPTGARELLLSLSLGSPAGPGHYFALACEQLDGQGQVLARQVDVMTARQGDKPLRLLVHIEAGARGLRLRLAHANEPLTVRIEASELCFLDPGPQGLPLGAVGLAAAAVAEIPRLLRDLVARHEHYRAQARQFARAYGELHSPDTVVARLTTPLQPGVSAADAVAG